MNDPSEVRESADDRVSLAPLGPEEALWALLRVDPNAQPTEAENAAQDDKKDDGADET